MTHWLRRYAIGVVSVVLLSIGLSLAHYHAPDEVHYTDCTVCQYQVSLVSIDLDSIAIPFVCLDTITLFEKDPVVIALQVVLQQTRAPPGSVAKYPS